MGDREEFLAELGLSAPGNAEPQLGASPNPHEFPQFKTSK